MKLYGCIYKFWYMPRKCIMSSTNYTFNERNKKGNTFYKSLCICTLISQISSPRTYKIKFKQSTTICPKFKLIFYNIAVVKMNSILLFIFAVVLPQVKKDGSYAEAIHVCYLSYRQKQGFTVCV